MLPCQRTGQHQVEVELRIPAEHLSVSRDEARKIFSRLDCAMMEDVGAVDAQAVEQLLKQGCIWRDATQKFSIIAFIHNVNFRLRNAAYANEVLAGVFRNGNDRGGRFRGASEQEF